MSIAMELDNVGSYRPYNMNLVRQRSSACRFKVISTFSGGGGSSTGYRLAGGAVLGANEFVPEAARTYRSNYPDCHVNTDDIRKLLHSTTALTQFLSMSGTARGALDLLDGSPPCCQFSTAGSGISDQGVMRAYSDVRQNHIATLAHDFAELAIEVNPKTIVMENVPQILTTGSEIFEGVRRRLRVRYFTSARVLSAHEYGVPQKRRRAFLVGIRHDVAKQVGIHSDDDVQRVFPTQTTRISTIRDAFAGLKQSPRDMHVYVKSARMSSLGGLIGRLPKEPAKNTKLAHISPGETKHFSLVRTSWDLPAPTLTASGQKPNGLTGVCHPLYDRKFTIPELKRLSGLPDDFILTGTVSQAAERICRMVPPPLTAALAESIYENVLEPYRVANER